ncbi:MAG: alpha/beta fold hydrolase [Chromatiales bacterium]
MRTNHVLGLGSKGFHRVHYTEWGDPENSRVLLCVHGLTRNGRDFDFLAERMQDVYRIVCPDLPGRGQSDWLSDPTDYDYRVYAADMAILIARLNVPQVDWLGTSMGGLLGMVVAAAPNSPVRRFVLNDIGPAIPEAAMTRIGAYVGKDERFADLCAAEEYVRATYGPFGALTNAQWQHLARHSVKQLPDGQYALHYDPAIGQAFRRIAGEALNLWGVWDAIRCPVLVLRGEQSDVLSPEMAQEMKRRNPRAEVVEVRGAGHAPPLMADDQIKLVRDWLLKP